MQESLSVGQNIQAVVNSVTDDGLTVSFGGYFGIVRIIDLKWDLSNILSVINDEYKVGDSVSLKITAVDGERFLGSIKDLHPSQDPWFDPSIYHLGSIFEGTIDTALDYGYLIKLNTGALAHLSDGCGKEFVKGDAVRVKIISTDVGSKKIKVELAVEL